MSVRQDAINAGQKTYKGNICARNHKDENGDTIRFTTSGGCVECLKEVRAAYFQTPNGKEAKRRWSSSDKRREYMRFYMREYRARKGR